MTEPLGNAQTIPGEGAFTVRLLDAAQGRVLQTWSFDGFNVVRLGRQEDNDIVVLDPRVSRLHATIQYVDQRWELKALGKHGVYVQDRRVDSLHLQHECVFHLGCTGVALQFIDPRWAIPQDSEVGRTTLGFDSAGVEALGIDEMRVASEVQEITANESFQRLLGRARELRERRVREDT